MVTTKLQTILAYFEKYFGDQSSAPEDNGKLVNSLRFIEMTAVNFKVDPLDPVDWQVSKKNLL